jgi:thymidine phosphorylase
MVRAHGGDTRAVEHPERLPSARSKLEVLASKSGYVTTCDAYALGLSSVALGAGRTRADQAVDPSAGLEVLAKRGDLVKRGEPIARIHARSKSLAESEVSRVQSAFIVAKQKPKPSEIVLERVTH